MNPPNYVGARVGDVRLGVPLWSPILVRCPQDTPRGCPARGCPIFPITFTSGGTTCQITAI